MCAVSFEKPWLKPHDQIRHLISKGVKFELMSEGEAEQYLELNNNYFRLRSYRTGFPKVEEGPREGQYANLDFKMLVDLSIVDMLLRYEMLPLTLDVEHFMKVELLRVIDGHDEDGYCIVQDFFSANDRKNDNGDVSNTVKNEIDRGRSSAYVSGLLDRYPYDAIPVWVLLELVSFGTFIYFFKFCAERYNDGDMFERYYQLQSVKSLRNACAHNNCILNDMSAGSARHNANYEVRRAVGNIGTIGRDQLRSKLSNDRIQQITTSLYLHSAIAPEGVRGYRAKSLHAFVKRMNRHLDYYSGNMQIASGFKYLTKLVDAWYPKNLIPPTE